MMTNDLRKGDRVRLRNGWCATIEDNRKGNTRVVTVEGFVTEMGSIYAHDILCRVNPDNSFDYVTHTPAQLKLQKRASFLDAMARTF